MAADCHKFVQCAAVLGHVGEAPPDGVAAIVRATPGTGLKLWLLDGNGDPFNESSFSHWFADCVDDAGLPKKMRPNGDLVRECTPHGLRKLL